MNVRDLARKTNTISVIERAISYNPSVLGRVWDVPVQWGHRLKTSSGNANRYRIKLHPALDDIPQELRATFLHELAHTMAHLEHGREGLGHSQTWWEAMIRLGEKPWQNRFHSVGKQLREYNLAAKNGLLEADANPEEMGF